MNILICGGTGYLATRLIEELLCLDCNIFPICRKNSKAEKKYAHTCNVTYIESDYIKLREIFSKIKFDCIINASCTYMYKSRIDDVVESNLIFPTRILSLAVESYYGSNSNYVNNPLRFISIGTGLPDNFNLYTYTKKHFNKLGEFFSNKYGLEFVNIELENYFGENEPKNRFLPSVIDKLKNNEDIPLTQGEQLRDFIYIEDVVNAILLLINKKSIPPYIDVPLGSGDAPSIKVFITYIKEIMNSKSELQFGKVPLRPNEPSSFANLAMYNMLGGKIKYSWKEGIKKMLVNEGLI